MPSILELTPSGRLLAREPCKTVQGHCERVTDVTDQAHHRLGCFVVIQPETRLSAVLELFKANDALQDIYTSNWIQDYLVRYEAIRSGEFSLMVHPSANAATEESAIKALVLTPYRELEFSYGLLDKMANAKHSALNAAFKYFDLTAVDSASNANKEIPRYSVNEASSYWNLSGRSAPLKSDTTLSGINYKAGSQIDYHRLPIERKAEA